jgi:hypothetical protein
MSTIHTDQELEVVPLARLQVDETYQREERDHLIKKILAEGFDINAAYPLKVSERPPLKGTSDVRYFIVDGRHRAKAAMRSGETEAIIEIIRFKGSEAKIVQQEADLRRKMGDRKPDTPMERFKADLRRGSDTALKIDSVVESFGATLALKQGIGGIEAISTIQKLHERGTLRRVLSVIRQGWDTFDGRAGEAATFEALSWLVQKHPNLDEAHLVRRMKGIPPEAVHARAHAIKAGMGGSLWKNYYRALVEVYNTRAPAKIDKLTPIDF